MENILVNMLVIIQVTTNQITLESMYQTILAIMFQIISVNMLENILVNMQVTMNQIMQGTTNQITLENILHIMKDSMSGNIQVTT